MQTLTDKEIIQNIKRGRIDLFSILVNKYASLITNFVNQKVFDKSEAEDIVQLSFIKFYKAVSRFDENKPILPYLYQIVRNEIKMYFRSHKKTVALDEAIQISEEKELYGFEEQDLEKILSQLKANQKKALQLLYDGHTYQEIAKELKVPLNTVRTIIRRARLKILKNQKNETRG